MSSRPRRRGRLHALRSLFEAARTGTFWALAASFFVCGATTVGLIAVHFIPAAHDHGMPATTAAGMLAVMGILDIAGDDRVGLADRPHGPAQAAVLYVRAARRLAGPAVQRADDAELHAGAVRRVLRPRLDRHRPADRRPRRARSVPRSPASSSAGCSLPPDRRRGRRYLAPASCAAGRGLSAGVHRQSGMLCGIARWSCCGSRARRAQPAPLPATAPATP